MVAHLYPRREVLSRAPQAPRSYRAEHLHCTNHRQRPFSIRTAEEVVPVRGGVSPRVDAAFLDLPSPLWHRRRTLSFVNVSTGSVSDLEGERRGPAPTMADLHTPLRSIAVPS